MDKHKKLNITQCCAESPVMGGKHKTPSKFCSDHSDQSVEVTPPFIPSDFNYFVSKSSDEIILPDNEDNDVLVGCRKASNVNRFYDRTAGIMAFVRPCGIIVNFTEMFTCESPTQAYIFLYSTFGRCLDDFSMIKYLGYDTFLKNLKKKGSLGAKILLEHVSFLVDIWHCNKHKEPTCMQPDNPQCIYHPTLPKFHEVHGANTECAEQAFKWLGRFKYITRRMTRKRFCFFLWKMIELYIHNKRVIRKLFLDNKLTL